MQEQTATTVEPAIDDPTTEAAQPDGAPEGAQDEVATDAASPAAGAPDAGAPDAGTADAGAPDAGGRPRWRVVASWLLTALAFLFIFLALVMPNRLGGQKPFSYLRLPFEPLLAIAFLLALRPRLRPWVAGFFGAVLGLLIVVKITDTGFYASLNRPFNLVLDWVLLPDAVAFLEDSVGRAGGIATVVVVIVLAAGLVTLGTLAALRVDRLVAAHSRGAIRSVLVLGVVWVTLAAFGVQMHPQSPVATRNTFNFVKSRAFQVRDAMKDKQVFAAEAKVDAFANTPGDQLLTALRGKDVVLTFVESYGRSAIEDPRLAPVVDPALDAGTRELKAAGFASRSAFLTSSTVGGGSWLAHSTLLSGLWISTQQRYRTLLASDRLSLVSCFDRAGWRTASFEPNTTRGFPEAKTYYGFNQVYTNEDFGYRGPNFSWSRMPDQYTLETFEHKEYGTPGRGPLLGEIVLTSSHSPWVPVPKMVDWDSLGDGTVFGPIEAASDPLKKVWKDKDRVREGYAKSIAYSVQSLVSFVTRYGKDNLVLIFLGDHQPAPLITGDNAGRDVPITIVAHDPAVLDRIAGWKWQDGLNPNPRAPVVAMDKFRDQFLTAFGPQGTPSGSPSQAPAPAARPSPAAGR